MTTTDKDDSNNKNNERSNRTDENAIAPRRRPVNCFHLDLARRFVDDSHNNLHAPHRSQTEGPRARRRGVIEHEARARPQQ